ncbi:MAG: hypothetical protein AABY95_11310 [Pseudomonadota bacterium]|mgnify:CR=1 FL=1
MGILSRLQSIRRAGESLVAERLNGEALSLSAEIPGSKGPLWQMQLEMKSEPQAGGERLRLRAHFKLSLRKALPAPGDAQAASSLPARVGQWVERRLDTPLMQTLAAPLLDRELNTWVEMQTSTAALDAGAKALLPTQLARLGIEPKNDQPVQAWAGELRGAKPGFAQMTLLQLDQRHIPPNLQQVFADRPFQLSAAIVNVIEEA